MNLPLLALFDALWFGKLTTHAGTFDRTLALAERGAPIGIVSAGLILDINQRFETVL